MWDVIVGRVKAALALLKDPRALAGFVAGVLASYAGGGDLLRAALDAAYKLIFG